MKKIYVSFQLNTVAFDENDAIRTSATLAETFAEAEQGKTFAELFGEVQQ